MQERIEHNLRNTVLCKAIDQKGQFTQARYTTNRMGCAGVSIATKREYTLWQRKEAKHGKKAKESLKSRRNTDLGKYQRTIRRLNKKITGATTKDYPKDGNIKQAGQEMGTDHGKRKVEVGGRIPTEAPAHTKAQTDDRISQNVNIFPDFLLTILAASTPRAWRNIAWAEYITVSTNHINMTTGKKMQNLRRPVPWGEAGEIVD